MKPYLICTFTMRDDIIKVGKKVIVATLDHDCIYLHAASKIYICLKESEEYVCRNESGLVLFKFIHPTYHKLFEEVI